VATCLSTPVFYTRRSFYRTFNALYRWSVLPCSAKTSLHVYLILHYTCKLTHGGDFAINRFVYSTEDAAGINKVRPYSRSFFQITRPRVITVARSGARPVRPGFYVDGGAPGRYGAWFIAGRRRWRHNEHVTQSMTLAWPQADHWSGRAVRTGAIKASFVPRVQFTIGAYIVNVWFQPCQCSPIYGGNSALNSTPIPLRLCDVRSRALAPSLRFL